jgi:hypothetical protein
MDTDGNTRKYRDVYEFFKRVAAQSAEFDSAARKFSSAFRGPAFLVSQRNHQHHLAIKEAKSDTVLSAQVY